MRHTFSLFVIVSCAGLALSGCGGDSIGLVEHTGDLSATGVVIDLVDRLGSAEIVRDGATIDIGSIGSSAALVEGWGEPETAADSGLTFAWVVADRATLETNLLRDDARELQLRCRPFDWNGSSQQRLSIAVNGHEVGDAVLAPGFHDYSFPLPGGTIGEGLNRVELGFSSTAVPAEHLPGNTDQRSLAAAFQWVSFGPPETGRTVVSKDPTAHGSEVLIPPGTGLRYRLTVPKDGVLDFGLAARPSTADHLRGRIWVAKPGNPATTSVLLDPSVTAGDRIRFDLPSAAGHVVELVLASTGDARDSATLVYHTPRILGDSNGVAEIASVLLIVVDTLRSDYLGSYGGEVETPNIDALAARGVRFKDARSHIPITGPSHASLFTSLLPMEHGVRNNAQKLDRGFPTLAESLRSSGRQTAAVISLGVLQREFGFDHGFEIYGDGFPRDWLKDAAEVTDEALNIAEKSLAEPYFLWVHYSDPHEPYAPSDQTYPRFGLRLNGKTIGEIDAGGRGFRFDLDLPPGDSVLEFLPLDEGEPGRVYRVDNILIDDESIGIDAIEGWNVIPRLMGRTTYESKFPASARLTNPTSAAVGTGVLVSCKKLMSMPEIREAYTGETEFVDGQIGRLLVGLEERGLMDNTLVIFASDHGEGLGNHEHVGHIRQLYDSLLHVPLIFVWKGHLQEGRVVDEVVSLVDVFPTVANLLGIDSPSISSGASLVPLLHGESMPSRPVIAATYRPESFSDKRAIVLDGFKYILTWKDDRVGEELFDLTLDPGELENLAQVNLEDLDRLREELERLVSEISEASVVEAELSEEEKAHLRALGYLH